MKRHLFFFLTLILCVIPSFADKKDRGKMMEDILKFKIDFLAQEMGLSEKAKADFAPLYVEYDNELRKTGSDAFRFERELKKKKDATDDDYKKLAELQKKSREDFDAVNKRYEPRFEEILNAKQIYLMHKGEEKFFDKMKEMKRKHVDKKHKANAKTNKKEGKHSPSPDIP